MVAMQVVVTACDEAGNVDLNDLRAKVELYGDQIAALMITYPSTHGVFEENIRDICQLIHSIGAQVYIDGANMNALEALPRPVSLAVMCRTSTCIKPFVSPRWRRPRHGPDWR